MESVLWEDGSPAVYARPEDSQDVWIHLASAPAGARSLTFFYAEDLFEEFRNLWVEMKSPSGWQPVYKYDRPATYRMTFRHHERYAVASVGSKVSESEADGADMELSTWETPQVRQITFNLGRFTEHEVGKDRFPNLTIQVDEVTHDRLASSIDAFNAAVGRNCFIECPFVQRQQEDMVVEVAQDLREAFLFFSDVYGQTTVDAFTDSEIPYDHGLAFPGLVLLSWSTFGWTDESGYDEIFRAHEVAHQWWGIGVRPASYHDQWLAEGFSEFSGLWYAARARGSLPMFLRRLRETREEIFDRREEAGPIWLEPRSGSSRDPQDAALTVYQKGAWVLHMLRIMRTFPSTPSRTEWRKPRTEPTGSPRACVRSGCPKASR